MGGGQILPVSSPHFAPMLLLLESPISDFTHGMKNPPCGGMHTLHMARQLTYQKVAYWTSLRCQSGNAKMNNSYKNEQVNSNVTFSKFTFWVFQESENFSIFSRISVIIVVSQVTDVSNNYQMFHVSTLCAEFFFLLFEVLVIPDFYLKTKNYLFPNV